MDIDTDWPLIRQVFEAGLRASRHCAIASVNAQGRPHVTPIGFIFLRDDKTAFYFEQYTRALPANFEHSRQVCLMTVNGGAGFWLRSLWRGRFLSYPGIRLYGEVGERRKANPQELATLAARIGGARHLRGSKLIWSDLAHVRDIRITGVEPVKYPRMMAHLP
ncbi:MAG: pyridoxamine 5'-phosphate oxidase family protein [Aquabacterium sp.]